jgi:prepilin signal peptidase PulO-like enzyme (type II secretory pathway)
MADLIPVFSWLWLRGKCRYCQKPISWQYPVVESITAMSFIVSYLAWPSMLSGWESINFGLWLVILTGLIALIVYDLRWMLLPNRIIFPLLAVAVIKDVILLRRSGDPLHQFIEVIGALAISGGIFYLIFQFSAGKWIGGGDVKLGLLLGLVLAQPSFALLQVFLASLLGTLAILPAWIRHRVTSTSKVPYGPFLILSTFIVILWGSHIINWYQNLFSSGHF